jgi:hypothetical protein
VRNEFHILGIFAIWLMLIAGRGFVQSPAVSSSQPSPMDDTLSLSLLETPLEQPVPAEISSDCLQCNPSSARNDGITVSMLDGKSQLKIFGSLSALTIFSTDRPFAPGLPLFLLPSSPFGLNTNTFDIHARQSNIGASFIGPQTNGFTPSATFVSFIANDTLTGDSYGLLPYNAFGELKSEDWRFAAGLQNDVFNPHGKSNLFHQPGLELDQERSDQQSS